MTTYQLVTNEKFAHFNVGDTLAFGQIAMVRWVAAEYIRCNRSVRLIEWNNDVPQELDVLMYV